LRISSFLGNERGLPAAELTPIRGVAWVWEGEVEWAGVLIPYLEKGETVSSFAQPSEFIYIPIVQA
jgi:hypothetical protein